MSVKEAFPEAQVLRCCFHVERNAKRWQRDSEMPQRGAHGRKRALEKYADTQLHAQTHPHACMEGDVRMPAHVYMSAQSSGAAPRTLSFRKEEENAYVFRNENVNICFRHGSKCLKSGME